MIRVMKTRYILTRTRLHVIAIPISAENYLRNEVMKGQTQQTDDKLSELMDKFEKKIEKEEALIKMERERERERTKGDTLSRKYAQIMS